MNVIKSILKAFWKIVVLIVSILSIFNFILIWTIYGFFRGIHVWAWNMNNGNFGNFEINIPKKPEKKI